VVTYVTYSRKMLASLKMKKNKIERTWLDAVIVSWFAGALVDVIAILMGKDFEAIYFAFLFSCGVGLGYFLDRQLKKR